MVIRAHPTNQPTNPSGGRALGLGWMAGWNGMGSWGLEPCMYVLYCTVLYVLVWMYFVIISYRRYRRYSATSKPANSHVREALALQSLWHLLLLLANSKAEQGDKSGLGWILGNVM